MKSLFSDGNASSVLICSIRSTQPLISSFKFYLIIPSRWSFRNTINWIWYEMVAFMRASINLIRSIWKSHVIFSQKFSSYQVTSLHLLNPFGNCNTFPIKFTLSELLIKINSSYFTDQQSTANQNDQNAYYHAPSTILSILKMIEYVNIIELWIWITKL